MFRQEFSELAIGVAFMATLILLYDIFHVISGTDQVET